ncbi:MAG: T9SS type A sorting domain-containing protein [Bacteroidota bacterium]|nr:T9SS type A sorting domain-containing protein [Bacteroidota bacterium]
MKTKKIQSLVLGLIVMISISSSKSFSTIHNVTVANFSFTPSNINVTVGDTIKWNWVSGGHTTTCNGTSGSTRPTGAAAWDAGINNGSPTFSYIITVAGSYHYVCLPHAPDMAGNINAEPSSISQLTEIVSSFELSQNYPNPFNPTTNIKFSIPNSSIVTLTIYNNTGMEVETLVNEKFKAGGYKVDWNAVNFTSGIYYYKIQAGEFIETKKMLLIK